MIEDRDNWRRSVASCYSPYWAKMWRWLGNVRSLIITITRALYPWHNRTPYTMTVLCYTPSCEWRQIDDWSRTFTWRSRVVCKWPWPGHHDLRTDHAKSEARCSGVAREGWGGPPRVTPSRGWHPSEKNCGLNLERTLDERRRKVKVVTRRQLKRSLLYHYLSLCRG